MSTILPLWCFDPTVYITSNRSSPVSSFNKDRLAYLQTSSSLLGQLIKTTKPNICLIQFITHKIPPPLNLPSPRILLPSLAYHTIPRLLPTILFLPDVAQHSPLLSAQNMVDKATTKQSPTVKAGPFTTDMAARPFQCEWHQGCPKVSDPAPTPPS